MKAWYTVAEVASLFGKSRRQMRDDLVARGVIEARGRGRGQRIPLTALMAAYDQELQSLALAQRLTP